MCPVAFIPDFIILSLEFGQLIVLSQKEPQFYLKRILGMKHLESMSHSKQSFLELIMMLL